MPPCTFPHRNHRSPHLPLDPDFSQLRVLHLGLATWLAAQLAEIGWPEQRRHRHDQIAGASGTATAARATVAAELMEPAVATPHSLAPAAAVGQLEPGVAPAAVACRFLCVTSRIQPGWPRSRAVAALGIAPEPEPDLLPPSDPEPGVATAVDPVRLRAAAAGGRLYG